MKEVPTLHDFKTDYDTLKELVPQIAEEELSPVMIADFYDGPLEGIVEYKGQKFWYEVVSDFVNQQSRYFALVELSNEDYKVELYWHRLFEDHVSKGLSEEQKAEWESTYGVYQKQRENTYGGKQVVGWFCTE